MKAKTLVFLLTALFTAVAGSAAVAKEKVHDAPQLQVYVDRTKEEVSLVFTSRLHGTEQGARYEATRLAGKYGVYSPYYTRVWGIEKMSYGEASSRRSAYKATLTIVMELQDFRRLVAKKAKEDAR